MALQIWLPLNGDLTNQGLSNVTVTNNGATVDNNGKIGKCYRFDGDVYLNLSKGMDTTKDYSICYWVKEFENNTLGQFRVVYQCGGLIVGQYGTYLNIYNGSGSGLDVTAAIDTTTWHHACFTFQSSENLVTIYIDGKYATSKTVTSIPTSSSSAVIGKRSSGTHLFQGTLNDFRIYDHCLSQKEVQELAKGLVLHYRLAGPGQPNLIKASGPNEDGWGINQSGGVFTKTITSECTSFEVTTQATSWFLYYHKFSNLSSVGLKPNTQYTYSFDCKSNQSFTLNIKLLKGNGTSNLTNAKDVRIEGDNEWHRYKVTLTTNATLDISDQYFYMTGGNVLSKTHFRYAKFEEGPIATPWTPHSSDTLWTTMGYSNNIEYDCSGYKHNGTPVSTTTRPTWDADSPRYTTSFNYSGKTSQANYTTSTDMNFTDNFSWAIWIKPNYTAGSAQYVFTGGRADAGGYGYGLQVASATSCTIFYGNNGRYAVGAKSGEWHHVAFTKAGTTCKCYLDGKLISTNTFGGTNPTYSDGNGVGIGCFHYTGDIYPYFGKASDLRIYATCLSDDDIAELYRSAVIIDNTGKTYAYEYFEAT